MMSSSKRPTRILLIEELGPIMSDIDEWNCYNDETNFLITSHFICNRKTISRITHKYARIHFRLRVMIQPIFLIFIQKTKQCSFTTQNKLSNLLGLVRARLNICGVFVASLTSDNQYYLKRITESRVSDKSAHENSMRHIFYVFTAFVQQQMHATCSKREGKCVSVLVTKSALSC